MLETGTLCRGWLLPVVSVLLAVSAPCARAAELEPKTVAAFDRYIEAVERSIDARLQGQEPFLLIDASPEDVQRARNGEIVISKLEQIEDFDVPKGLIHDWVGTAFIPRTPDQVLSIQRDYDHHSEIYPEITASKLLSSSEDQLTGYLRFKKTQIITVVLDTVNKVHYEELPGGRRYVRSHSTKINQVENAGTPEESLLPEGNDGGYLWRLYAYWLLEPVDGGTLVECRAVTLTRGVPMLVSWIVKPFVTGVPRESLTRTLNATRQAVLRAFPDPAPSASAYPSSSEIDK